MRTLILLLLLPSMLLAQGNPTGSYHTGSLKLTPSGSPPTAVSGIARAWAKTDNTLHFQDPLGADYTMQRAVSILFNGATLTSYPQSLNFTGAGVAVTNNAGALTVNIPGGTATGAIDVRKDGVNVVVGAGKLDFRGSGFLVTDAGSGVARVDGYPLLTVAGSNTFYGISKLAFSGPYFSVAAGAAQPVGSEAVVSFAPSTEYLHISPAMGVYGTNGTVEQFTGDGTLALPAICKLPQAPSSNPSTAPKATIGFWMPGSNSFGGDSVGKRYTGGTISLCLVFISLDAVQSNDARFDVEVYGLRGVGFAPIAILNVTSVIWDNQGTIKPG